MQINRISQDPKKSKVFWANALVEAGAGQHTGSCIPPTLEMPYYKWEGSLEVFYLILPWLKLEARLTGRTILHLIKFYFYLKIVM